MRGPDRTLAVRAGDPVEALDDLRTLRSGDPGPVSSTLKYGTPSRTPVLTVAAPPRGRVAQSVVDQVVEQLRNEQRIALDQRRLERESEIDLVRDRLREPVARRGVADRHQVDDFERPAVIRRALGLRQREQLVRQAARATVAPCIR
jgi:hypothetical protein